MNEWVKIPGSEKFEISIIGEVRKKLKNGKFRRIKAYRVKGKWLAVRVDINGIYKQWYLHKLMALTYGLVGKSGEVLHFKNGDITDPALTNLEYIDRQLLGQMTGAMSKRKPVAKLDSNGEIIEIYSSARECGRKNYFSYQTVIDRCNGKTKSKVASDGYSYIWEEKFVY